MTNDLEGFLESLDLGGLAATFAENGVDFDALRLLDESDFKELGLLLGHRKKLLHALGTNLQPPVPTEVPQLPSNVPTEERRQLTVMFCDLVDFTELAGRVDPEVLRRILRSYEDVCAACVTHFEGYVSKHLGDGIVAFFGYPLAHEGEAERAILAALEIVETLAQLEVPEAGRLSVRIGIATGLVVVSAVDNDAWGETMNLAARLQAIAPVGSVVVSERVRRLAGGSFLYKDDGERLLKGIAKPVRTFQVQGRNSIPSRFEAATVEGLTDMVGREQEIDLLLDRWAMAQDGEGQVVMLSGEPGIGKSRVLSALRDRLERLGTETLRFQCSPYYVNSPLWPSLASFERALQFRRDESVDDKLDKLERLVVEGRGRPVEDVRYLASILSLPCEERYGEVDLTPQRLKNEVLRSLVDMTAAAASTRPTVMFYEDIHWADPTSLEVLDLLVDRVRHMRLLVVFTHRPDFQQRWGGHGHVSALNLSKLTASQSGQIISRLSGGRALPEELFHQILEKTDGVPLYVEELTKSLLESGALRADGDRYVYVGTDRSVTIPVTLRDLLMERLDRFAPVKEIAQIGAAIGREFSYELVAAIANLGETDLDTALQQLTDSGLAFRRGTAPDATYTFKHALVQDAAYDSMLKSRRQLLHGRIAKVLETQFPDTAKFDPQLLAHHLTEAGQSAEAIHYWLKAGMQSSKSLSFKEAVSQLRHGLALIVGLPETTERNGIELDLRTNLGTAWLALDGWQSGEAWTALEPAVVLAKELDRHEALMPVYWGLWVYVLTQGRIEEAKLRSVEMLTLAESLDDADLRMTGHRTASVTEFYLGHFEKCCEHGELVYELYDDEQHWHIADVVNTDPKTAIGNFASGALWMLGYPERATAMSDAKDAHARHRGHPFDLGYALTWGAQVWDLRRETERLLERAEEAEALGRAHRLPFISEVLAQLIKGLAWIRSRRFDEGIPQFRGAMERWTDAGGLALLPYYRSVLAEGLAASGEPTAGLVLLEESLEQISRPGWGERSHHAEVLRLRGSLRLQTGDSPGAERSYAESLAVAQSQNAKSWELRTATSLASLWQNQGRRADAFSILDPVYRWFTEGLETHDLVVARTLLAELRG
jgi:class 3 adenylate cyclase